MRTHVLFILAFGCAMALAQSSDSSDAVPIGKYKALEKYTIEREMKAASSDFAIACINLTRDVADKRLTVYSVGSIKRAITNESGFNIQVIYHKELAQNYEPGLGTYQAHYNACLLDFDSPQKLEKLTMIE